MRVLVINWLDRRNPTAGGAEVHLHEVFGRLGARGHEVTLIAAGWPGAARRETVDGIEVHRTGSRNSFAIAGPRLARRMLANRPFDVLVEDFNKLPLLTPKWVGLPRLVIAHHLFGRSAFSAAPLPIALTTWAAEHLLLRAYRGTRVHAVSGSTAQDLVARGMRVEDIAVVHNGVAMPETYARAPVRDGVPTFLYLGRLVPYKNVDLLLTAIGRLRDEGVHARLLIAGRGSEDARLRTMAAALRLGGLVEFLGFVDEDDKETLYGRAWANVLVSAKEGWGLSVYEAASVGTPSIVAEAPGLRDAVRHGVTGLRVPPRDPVALAGAMRLLAGDPDLVRSLGARARDAAQARTWERTVDYTEQDLLAIANGGVAPLEPGDTTPYVTRPPASGLPPGRSGLFDEQRYTARFLVRGRSVERRFLIGSLDAAGQQPWLREFGAPRDTPALAGTPLAGWPISAPDLIRRYLLHQGITASGSAIEVRRDRPGGGGGAG